MYNIEHAFKSLFVLDHGRYHDQGNHQSIRKLRQQCSNRATALPQTSLSLYWGVHKDYKDLIALTLTYSFFVISLFIQLIFIFNILYYVTFTF